MSLITLQEAQNKYGDISSGRWDLEARFCCWVEVPAVIAQKMRNSGCNGSPTNHIYCNKDMAQALGIAFQNIISRGLVDQLETYDGCLMIRDVRGETGRPSTHSYALAIDINAGSNKLGDCPSMTKELVSCFTDAGFKWGGDFHRRDGMHMQYADW